MDQYNIGHNKGDKGRGKWDKNAGVEVLWAQSATENKVIYSYSMKDRERKRYIFRPKSWRVFAGDFKLIS